MNKNQIMLDYLQQCEAVKQLYFQYGEMRAGAMQLMTNSVESAARAEYIDGSRPRQLDYSLIWYKPISIMPVRNPVTGQYNANIAELDDVQGIIDWITDRQYDHDLPDFGPGCEMESIRCLHEVPQLLGIDVAASPPLARYSLTIRVEFVDTTRRIFN